MSKPNSTLPVKSMKFAAILIVSLILSGCGFQLKQSAAIPTSFGPASIEGADKHSTLYKAIRNTLKQSSIPLTDSKSATSKIVIQNLTNDRRILSVGSSGKVSEYDLTKTLSFVVLDNSGNAVIETRKLSVNRSYTVSSTDVLGKGLEEDDLNIRMEQDLVDRMFRYIASQL